MKLRINVVGSLFQFWSGPGISAVATGVDIVPELFLGLLLEGFYVAPRGMAGIPLIATETDIDEFVAAIGRTLRKIERVPTAATS